MVEWLAVDGPAAERRSGARWRKGWLVGQLGLADRIDCHRGISTESRQVVEIDARRNSLFLIGHLHQTSC